jgi:predicted HTH transcriptional regulator
MTEEQFRALIAAGRESESVEAKPGGLRTDAYLGARVVRSALGMTNHEGGGFIVIGIEEQADGMFDLVGIPAANLPTWNHDDVSAMINGVADPHISIDTNALTSDGRTFVVISVREFVDVPVVCRANGPTQPGDRQIYRKDACYARSRRKPETIEAITDATTWRTLMELAANKGARRILSVIGGGARPAPVPNDADRFAAQLGEFQ